MLGMVSTRTVRRRSGWPSVPVMDRYTTPDGNWHRITDWIPDDVGDWSLTNEGAASLDVTFDKRRQRFLTLPAGGTIGDTIERKQKPDWCEVRRSTGTNATLYLESWPKERAEPGGWP